MKYGEAKKQIEQLSSKYSIDMSDGDFNVVYKERGNTAYVAGYDRYAFAFYDGDVFPKLPFSNKLYMIMAELAMTPLDKRKEDKKYFIHVFKGEDGYLNIVNNVINRIEIIDNRSADGFKTEFTNDEINQLKKRDDVPLDWDKVTLEEVE